MIGELFEEDPQEDQPENPNQPEPEVEVMVWDQPSKPTQKEDLSTQEMLRILMEGNNKIQENNKRTNEKIDQTKEENREQRKKDRDFLSEKLDRNSEE